MMNLINSLVISKNLKDAEMLFNELANNDTIRKFTDANIVNEINSFKMESESHDILAGLSNKAYEEICKGKLDTVIFQDTTLNKLLALKLYNERNLRGQILKQRAKQEKEARVAAAKEEKERLINEANEVDELGRTALMKACENGCVECVKSLLRSGAKVNAVDRIGQTALMAAAEYGQNQIINILCNAGAKIGVKQTGGPLGGWNAFMLAVYGEHYSTVKLLFDLGANVNARDDVGQTALMLAAQKGNTSIVKFLINVGADINAQAQGGLTAIGFAENGGFYEVVSIIKRARLLGF